MPTTFVLFAVAAQCVKEEFVVEPAAWTGSHFEWIKKIPTGSKGKLGKRLIYQWAALNELSVDKCKGREADMLINGHRVEVKFSTLWDSGIYKFQQIRDQDYEYAVCLGISPFNAHCWIIEKATLKKYVIGHRGQHTGRGGKETSWLSVDPERPEEWLKPFGGSLDEALVILKGLKRR